MTAAAAGTAAGPPRHGSCSGFSSRTCGPNTRTGYCCSATSTPTRSKIPSGSSRKPATRTCSPGSCRRRSGTHTCTNPAWPATPTMHWPRTACCPTCAAPPCGTSMRTNRTCSGSTVPASARTCTHRIRSGLRTTIRCWSGSAWAGPAESAAAGAVFQGFHQFFDHRVDVTAFVGGAHVLPDVGTQHVFTHPRQGALHCLHLLQDVHAVHARIFEHADDAVQVPAGTLQAQASVFPHFPVQVEVDFPAGSGHGAGVGLSHALPPLPPHNLLP